MKMKSIIKVAVAGIMFAVTANYAAADELQDNVVKYLAKWKTQPPQVKTPAELKLSAADMERKRQAHVQALQKFAPYILNEYAAVDRSFNWTAGTFLDMVVFGVKRPPAAAAPHECTSWVVMPDLTGGRSMIVHKNRDSSARQLVAQMRAVPGKFRWIGMGNFGNLGTNMGMNSRGVVVVMNSGDRTADNRDSGIGTVEMARIMLENSASAAEAAAMLEKMINEKVYTHGKSGSIWFIADAENAYIAENNAEHIAVKSVYSGFAIRANSWDFPEMLPYSLAKPSDIVGNNRREYAVRDLLFRKHQVLNKPVTIEMMAEASRITEIPEDKKCYPLCGVATNSAATFVIDQEFPQELSYAVMAFSCPKYTLYLPIPLLVEKIPQDLMDGTLPNAAAARWKAKQPLMDENKMIALEAEFNARHRKAMAAARKVLRKNKDRAAAAKLLNKAFEENFAAMRRVEIPQEVSK